MDAAILWANGIDAATGGYLLPPLTPAQVSAVALGQPPGRGDLVQLRAWLEHASGGMLGPAETMDPTELGDAGWGVIFAADAAPEVGEALEPLLALRRRQAAARDPRRFRVFAGEGGYRVGESKREFLARHGVGPGPADPERVPYYLLIVGDPETVPYRFQHQLDVEYAVGRLHFATAGEYAAYARSVVEADASPAAAPRRVTFFGVRNPDDPATGLSAEHLLGPLAAGVARLGDGSQVTTLVAGEATRGRLVRLLGGPETPDVLFTTSHGVSFPSGDARQPAHQGALLCQDWPGPVAWRGPISEDLYLAGEHIAADARPFGLITFHYACYGAGTPRLDSFARRLTGGPVERAPRSFVSALPQRLLTHPRGGALAVVGHVDRAWGYSYAWPGVGEQLQVFHRFFERLLSGHPVGSAMEAFHRRYAELASELACEIEEADFGKRVDEAALSALWTATHDARNYVVLGDPAVRLRAVR